MCFVFYHFFSSVCHKQCTKLAHMAARYAYLSPKRFDIISHHSFMSHFYLPTGDRNASAQVALMLFLPLFTVYLALTSRVANCCSRLVVHHYHAVTVLKSSLQVGDLHSDTSPHTYHTTPHHTLPLIYHTTTYPVISFDIITFTVSYGPCITSTRDIDNT